MRRFVFRLLRGLGAAVVGSLRYAATLALVCGLWWYDANLLNKAFDTNLALIKGLGSAVDGSGRVEAAMRGFSAEKMLLFTEASIVVWTAARIICWPFGLAFRRWRRSSPEKGAGAQTAPRPAAASSPTRAEQSKPAPARTKPPGK